MKYGTLITWFFIALVIALALWLITYGEAHAQSKTCVAADIRERLRVLQLEAIDGAYQESVKHLFEVWMKDLNGQPARARVGITQATEAYIHARKAAMNWSPSACP